MSKFYIESKSGVIMGIYEGASAEDAVAALNADAGGEDSKVSDWLIHEVVGAIHDAEHDATLYMLDDGAVLVERGAILDYYSGMRAARNALAEG